MCQAVFDCNAG